MTGSFDSGLLASEMPAPDSAFAKRARAVVTNAEPAFLLNHSLRAYFWAVELARHDRRGFDPEILYVAALFHDVGLMPEYDTGGCFEKDGAIAAERFCLEQQQPEERAQTIHDAVALHMVDDLPRDAAPEVSLLWDSTGVDVSGYRIADVRSSVAQAVLTAYPRLGFKAGFSGLFLDQATRKPDCQVARRVASGAIEMIRRAPFNS